MEKWNRFLNEEVIGESSIQARKHFNIPTEKWMSLPKHRKQQIIDHWKQIQQKERSAQAQAQASRERSKTRSAEQPQASTPAAEPSPAAAEPSPAAAEPSPAAAEPSPAAAEPSPAAGGEESLDVGSGPEKALKVFMRDFLKSPLASLSKELAQEAKYIFTEYEPSEWEEPDVFQTVLGQGFTQGVLKNLNALARAHYQDGTAGAGEKYMEIREFIEKKLNPVLAHYNISEIPDINLWIDDYDGSMKGATQSTAEKYANGASAKNKVIGLTVTSRGGIAVHTSLG